MDLMCRVCLQTKNDENSLDFISIFETDSENDTFSCKIMKCVTVQIVAEDLFPKEICKHCVCNLDIAYKFVLQCKKSEDVFKEFLQTKEQQNYSLRTVNEGDECTFEVDLKPLINEKSTILKRSKKKRGRPKKLKKFDKIDERELHKYSDSLAKDQFPKLEDAKVKLEDEFLYNSFDEDCVSEEIVPIAKRKRGRPKIIHWDEEGRILPKKPKASLVCDKCGKSFKFMESLRGHQRRHTGEKPFVCSICGKSFHVLSEFKKHSNIHSGIKPYACKYCEKKFTDWGSRFKHERCHTGERPYQCDLCPKNFSYSYVLNRHKLTHTGNKSFSCNLCKKNFTLKYHLTNHNRKYHKDMTLDNPNAVKNEEILIPDVHCLTDPSIQTNSTVDHLEFEIKISGDRKVDSSAAVTYKVIKLKKLGEEDAIGNIKKETEIATNVTGKISANGILKQELT